MTSSKTLLQIVWLPRKIRGAILQELGSSLRKHRLEYDSGQLLTTQLLINQTKERLLKEGQRPREGIHDAAIAEVAGLEGKKAETLKKQLQRLRRRQRGTPNDSKATRRKGRR